MQAAQPAVQGAIASADAFLPGLALALGAIACTVIGYHVMQPLMEAARKGQGGSLTAGQLHAASVGFFGLKTVMVAALAWRAAAPGVSRPRLS